MGVLKEIFDKPVVADDGTIIDTLLPSEPQRYETPESDFASNSNSQDDRTAARDPETDEERSIVGAGHGVVLGSCGHVIDRCRCMHGANLIRSRVDELCQDCQGRQQYAMKKKELPRAPSFEQKLLGTYGQFSVYSVNGAAVRSMSVAAEDLGDYMTHETLTLVPRGEVWLNNELDDDEQAIATTAGLAYLKCIARGESKDQAADYADKVELRERGATKASQKKADKDTPKEIPPKVYVDPIFPIDDGRVLCWFVDADVVRDVFDKTWIEAGNHCRYPWIPEGQIWVEMRQPDWPVIILHEFIESVDMEGGLPYNQAHCVASQIEFEHRGRAKFTAEDARALTRDKAMTMILALGIEKAKKELE